MNFSVEEYQEVEGMNMTYMMEIVQMLNFVICI